MKRNRCNDLHLKRKVPKINVLNGSTEGLSTTIKHVIRRNILSQVKGLEIGVIIKESNIKYNNKILEVFKPFSP